VHDLLSAVEACTDLVEVQHGEWEGPNVPLADYPRIFGGQLLAQALTAAALASSPGSAAVVPGLDAGGMTPRSIHAVFTAAGHPGLGVRWSVARPHEGRSFATRSVTGRQGERSVAAALVSMHVAEAGIEHQIEMPEVSGPDSLATVNAVRTMPVEMRIVGDVPLESTELGAPEIAVWMRLLRPLRSASRLASEALLAYCSDGMMLVSALRPHSDVGFGSPGLVTTAVTSHTVSFHRRFSFDTWMLFAVTAPSASGARAYMRGDWFTEDGVLVASCAQEALVRTTGADPGPRAGAS
jgi:acyl-CoA thioesterase-2